MTNNYRLFCFPLLFVAILAGCATGPKLTQEQILGQYEQIAKLDKGLRDSVEQLYLLRITNITRVLYQRVVTVKEDGFFRHNFRNPFPV